MALTKTRTSLIQDVRIVLDMNEHNGGLGLVGDEDQLQTDEIISSCLDSAWVKLIRDVDLGSIVSMGESFSPDWEGSDDPKCQTAPLPSDIVRVVYVKLTGWLRPCTEFISVSETKYSQYRSEFAGIRPTKANPGCAIVSASAGQLSIEAYPNMQHEDEPIRVIYTLAGKTTAKIEDYLLPAFKYLAASLFYLTIGDVNRSVLFEQKYNKEIGFTSPIDNQPQQ